MKKEIVAAFDFDGTLTTRDALVPFLIHLQGPLRTANHLFWEIPTFIQFLLGIISRQATKEEVLSALIGQPKQELELRGQAFARGPLQKLVRPEALRRLQWHQEQGHRCILISANIDLFLKPWAELLQFQNLLCSELQYDNNNLATGKLKGINCWGEEKVRRLIELLGPREEFQLYAYGDSRGDRELLNMADFPFYCRMS